MLQRLLQEVHPCPCDSNDSFMGFVFVITHSLLTTPWWLGLRTNTFSLLYTWVNYAMFFSQSFIFIETFEELFDRTCYKQCVELGRFPCPDGSVSCGECLIPLTKESLEREGACERKHSMWCFYVYRSLIWSQKMVHSYVHEHCALTRI